LTVSVEKKPEPPKVTYHLKITASSELKKQPSKRNNKARILKVSQSLTLDELQDAIMEKVANALQLSTLISTYNEFESLFTIARKISDPTPLQSDGDYEVLLDNLRNVKEPAVSVFVCALKV
jgi:hypothetical protein